MNIIINGERKSIDSGMTISGLIAYFALEERKLAVEVNRSIVPASEHHRTVLAEGDRVEIIEAVGGG